ncbi:hypothetical protein SAMN04487983_10062 [Streptomyces sp. yr375]|uniref:hypothetical protein n=1 Tax=Streptomyces sp. yr375 TaxID=1761906 RepID=UPI0008AEC508|nr:hypothetical protein [Streptomyces sp. yr375]SEQ53245.1 hypothetical protein SAMN04487983_10062 [Streptomyces sp. yr375]
MGIRMHHRRTATARVHATATALTHFAPGTAPWTRPRPALAPSADTPRIPRSPATAVRTALRRALRTVAARLRRLVPRFVLRFVPRGDIWRPWTEAVRGYLALALGALDRLPRPRIRTARRIRVLPVVPVVPVSVATVTPLTGRPDGSAPR